MVDELILEIIARLPLKYAVQCSLLNKNFLHSIFHPSFQRRLLSSHISNTSIFCYSSKFFTRITPEPITLPLELSILASCNGVLLLRFRSQSSYHVFNPITGEIMFIDNQLVSCGAIGLGLAVNLDERNLRFKLVTIKKKLTSSEHSTFLFSVFVPSSTGGLVVKSTMEFDCERIPYPDGPPVYVHGCLHWLCLNGHKIIVFDVEKEKARIIDGPVKKNEPIAEWFGVADGSLQFVYSLPEEIVIQSHNYLKNVWQVKHKIANKYNPSAPLFFDGQHLFVKLLRREENGAVVMHHILSHTWEKTGKYEASSDCYQSFFSFFPTLAKVSNKYLRNYETEFPSRESLESTKMINSFERLRHLLFG